MASIAATTTLKGRVAIVTGVTREMGSAIAVNLCSLGAKLVLNYVSSSSEADLLAAELNNSYPSSPVAIAVKADISNPDDVKSLFNRAEQEFRTPPHILVNCAGTFDSEWHSLTDTTVENWETTFNVNAKGAFLVCREAANRLARGGGGRIVLITDSVVAASQPGYAAYTASKAAVEAMAKILAKELKGTGITVNCVAPGPIVCKASEELFAGKGEELLQKIVDGCPLGRLAEPNDIGQIVGFLVSDAGEWVNGQVIRVDGGMVV